MNIHLIGIGGVGMAGLAVLLKNRGHAVSGCDVHPGARTQWLESFGIRVFEGHDPKHVENADAVIVTPAVHADNPELMAARNVRYRGEVLAELVSEAKDSIAVCGSHGKTTTSTWIAKLLIALGENVEWAIGGETGAFPVAGNEGNRKEEIGNRGNGAVLVVEADESDGTLAKYHAKTLVVTNCEYDHPDHFKTREDYLACYETAKRQAGEVVEGEKLKVLDGLEVLGKLAPHNRKNARAAIEVALKRGHKLDVILAAMVDIVKELPDRRFQTIWPTSADPQPSTLNPQPSVTVVTDYAHHPTEMACAVQMARAICKGKLRVLFQPHRYSRTKALLNDFPKAFAGADEVVLCPTYAAFEPPIEGGDIADLYRECRVTSDELRVKDVPKFFLARSCDEAWEHARNSMTDGDVSLLLGAGDIIKLVPKIQNDLTFSPPRPLSRIMIGAGSNTWKSDLKLDVEYVKTDGPANAPGATLGIPWMAGIPGTIGGWVKMNAGAFGHSFSEVLEAVKVDGEWIAAADCGFGYRTSNITGEIQDVKLRSDEVARWRSDEKPEDYLAQRKKFPVGTKGSVFKNPPGDYAGRLLESAGCKGLRVGGAYVWEEHANVIVSGPDANNSDFLALARLMYNRVFFRFGVRLEPEVRGIEI